MLASTLMTGQFTGGHSINLGYDTDYLDGGGDFNASSNSGGAFGASDVEVTVTFDDGSSVSGTFQQESARRSTVVLNTSQGPVHTEFSLDDVVSNRGEEIPLNIDISNNENTSDYYISGLPDGAYLTEGEEVGDGNWIVLQRTLGS